MFCKKTGAILQQIERITREVMAKAERMHINIMNMVQEMVFTSRLPLTFWGNASEYAAYILNRNPNKANEGGISPNETLTKKRPGLNYIVVYGSP